MTEPSRKSGLNEILVEGAVRLSIALSPREISAFRVYGEELVRWSPRMNLTGFGTPEQIVRQGFLDSLACACLLPPNTERVLDVGSGAGFPSVPLAIVRPAAGFTLVEPSRKKTNFLRHIVRKLALTNVRVLAIRIEDLRHDRALLCAFDAAAARAVAPLPDVGAWVRPFLRVGGLFLAQVASGGGSTAALERLSRCGFEVSRASTVPVEFGKPGRRVVALRKTADQ